MIVLNESFWVAASLVLLVAMIFRPLRKIFLQALDARTDRIRTQLAEAKRMKEEAEALLEDFRLKHQQAIQSSSELMAHTEQTITRMREQAEKELSETLDKRAALAMSRIHTYEAALLQEVKQQAVDIAVHAVMSLLRSQRTEELSSDATDQLISDINKRLH
jgi:F-type H+-transporting ATPase subunit b